MFLCGFQIDLCIFMKRKASELMLSDVGLRACMQSIYNVINGHCAKKGDYRSLISLLSNIGCFGGEWVGWGLGGDER